MSDIIYIISKVDFSDRSTDLHQVSFEKVTKKDYEQFCKLKHPFLHFNPSKHHYVYVHLNKGWNIELIEDKDMIEAINKLWKYLPKKGHIDGILENLEGEVCMYDKYDE